MDTLLLVFTVVAGLSGWGAIAAWWLRERVKSIRALKETRRRNDRLQRAVIYALTKWREQVEHLRIYHAIEHEYAERLAREAGVSVQSVRSTIRAAVESQYGHREDPVKTSEEGAIRQIETIQQVQTYVETGKGTLADLEITEEIRRAA
ncbi:MAG: hypothetical protein MK085_03990 [Phycisphaerales bacterium]|nr:hypothetical protein [Phycisphaerales bacterium]